MLNEGLIKVGIPQEQISGLADRMEKYINEIILFNSAYNLTNTSDHDELVTRHILDSLAAYSEIKALIEEKIKSGKGESSGSSSGGGDKTFVMADIGSGGGLPGIPLAAVFPDVKIKLVERMSKRCAFLENCSAILGLKNVEVICSEAERVSPESFDLITFRAFRPLDKKMIKTLMNITKKGGYLAAYKAKAESIKEEMNAIASIVPEYTVKTLNVPGLEDSERNLVIIKK